MLHEERRMAWLVARGSRRLELIEISAEQLSQVRQRGRLPGDREYFSRRRNEFTHHRSGGRVKFVNGVAVRLRQAPSGIDMGLVGVDRGGIAAKHCECRRCNNADASRG